MTRQENSRREKNENTFFVLQTNHVYELKSEMHDFLVMLKRLLKTQQFPRN